MMKKHLLLLTAALVLAFSVGYAQDYDPATYCTGWHNPSNFTFTGGSANTQWEGLVGSKPAQASTCAGVPWISNGTPSVVPASQLASFTPSSTSCTSVNSVDNSGNSDATKRFVIKGRGTDAQTGNHLTYTPATYANGSGTNYTLDSNYTRSIRVGNFCGGGEAEALRYEFDVRAENNLMTLWYALSLQNGQHNAAQNPEFAVLVEVKNANNTWSRIGGDTLCYIQPTPTISTSDLSATGGYNFFVGSTGTHSGASYGCNVYLPWNKVVIPLYNYMYRRVRITIAAGDCSQTAHYACAYIAGDCEPMKLTSSGCSAGASDDVTRLVAPKGMRAYQWYRSRTGVLDEQFRNDLSHYQLIQDAVDSVYMVQAGDFVVDSAGRQVTKAQTNILCQVKSLMNINQPTKMVVSNVFTTVSNTKPTLSVDTLDIDCNGNITLQDISLSMFNDNNPDNDVDTTATVWTFYNAPAQTTGEVPTQTFTGRKTVTAHFDTPGAHRVKLRVSSFVLDENGDRYCWNEKEFPIRTMKPPVPNFTMIPDSIICEGEELEFVNTTTQDIDGRTYQPQMRGHGNSTNWHLQNNFGLDSTMHSRIQNATFRFQNTSNVTLTTFMPSIYRLQDTNRVPDGRLDTIYCPASITKRVKVETFPNLTVSGDTIVCAGNLSQVTVQSDVPVDSMLWYTNMNGRPFQTGNTMQESPQNDKTYYVRCVTPHGCASWDSLSIMLVKPKLTVPITQICDGEVIRLYGTGADHYSWQASPNDPNMQTSPRGDTLIVSPLNTTTYTLIGHGTNNCNADPLSQEIKVYHYPVDSVEISPFFIDSEDPTVTFRDVSRYGVSTLWDFGNGETSVDRQVKHTFSNLREDSVYIQMTSFNELHCGTDTGFYVPVSLFAVWFPNVITPTLSTNRTFKLYTHNVLENFSIYIYNRNGDLVLYSRDQDFQWDGKYKGKYCDQGVYPYVATYRRPGTSDIVTRKGTVTVLQ